MLVGPGLVLDVRGVVVVGLVVTRVVVGLVVVGLVVVGLVVGGLVVVGLVVGLGVLVGRGGPVPPFVGVSTWLPSQYIARPSSARFLSMVLMSVVPLALQDTPFAAEVLSGVGYSMWKTGLPAARKAL